MNWRQKLFSASNDEADIKAVLSVVAFAIAIGMYLIYGLKGLWVKWGMDPSIRDITIALIIGGAATAGSTLLNQRLGICQTPPVLPPPPPQSIPQPSNLPPQDGPAG